jgi:hypothetical protein
MCQHDSIQARRKPWRGGGGYHHYLRCLDCGSECNKSRGFRGIWVPRHSLPPLGFDPDTTPIDPAPCDEPQRDRPMSLFDEPAA